MSRSTGTASKVAHLSAEKRRLLRLLTERQSEVLSFRPSRRRRPNRTPLSFAQERLWFLDQLLPDRSVYNVPASIRISGKLNHHALERTLNEIVRRHEALRTTFQVVDDQPVQIITPPTETPLDVVDLQGLSPELRESRALKLASDEARRPFDLEAGPLFRSTLIRLDAYEHILLLTMHHIVSDGWSRGILTHEMSTLYEAFSNDKPSPLPELNIQYADFALWQRQWLQGDALQSQLSYWKQQLDGAPPVLELPSDRPRHPVPTFEGATAPFVLPKELSDSIKGLSRQEGLTLFMTLLAAFDTLLLHYSGQSDVVVGSPIANRNRSEIEGLIGFFVNTLVLRTDLSGNPTFRELMARVRDVALGAFAHQDLPFERLVEEIQPDRQLSYNPLFQIGFAVQNAPVSSLRLTNLVLTPITSTTGTAKRDLTLHTWETDTGLSGLWEYNTDLFDGTTISRMTGHLETLLQGIVNDPDQKLSDLPLLTDSEKQQILVEWNDTKTEYPSDKCIHQLFEQQVARSPDAIAIVYDDQQLSYGELNRRANQLAHYLRTLGVGPEVPVGVCMERSIDVVVAILGTLKAGGAYVPLDPQYPKERLDFMIRDARIQTVLTIERLADGLSGQDIDLVAMDTEWDKISRLTPQTSVSSAVPANLAYIIYTSGSTGTPKGVAVEHRQVLNYSTAVFRDLDLYPCNTYALVQPLAVDSCVTVLLASLLTGGSLHVVSEETASDPNALAHYFRTHPIDCLKVAPSHLTALQGATSAKEIMPRLRLVIGGEASQWKWARSIQSSTPHCTVFNHYGPTESTVGVLTFRVTPQDVSEYTSTPIGRPIGNTEAYLLDTHFRSVPIGSQGRLSIGGACVTRGYLNRPDQTAEKFIPNPFSQEPGSRLYDTGDIARYLPDGNIEFLGRADQQVKIRGYRIELGEVEAAIGQHPAVANVVAILADGHADVARVVAYMTLLSSFAECVSPAGAAVLQAELQNDYVSQWQAVFDAKYSQPARWSDPTFNLAGWNSSYDGLPIPEEQMREWTDATVERILSLKPDRVLEIGCGTGLILLRVAPHCAQYVGTDFSEAALDNLRQLLDDPALHLSHVSTLHRTADDFEGIEAGSFDTVVINSVAHCFPDIDYLSRVIEGTINALRPGGSIFLGDVRSLPLLEALHTSIQLHRSPPSMPIDILNQRIQRGIEQEEELVVDPSFFSSLKLKLPQIKHVHVQPKRGSFLNELNLFRYDVVLRVGVDPTPHMDQTWIDWRTDNLTLDTLLRTLSDDGPETLGIRSVPNARLSSETRAMTVLNGDIPPEHDTVGDLRQAVENDTDESGIDPEDIWALGQRLPYVVDISWASSRPDGSFDVLFRKRSTSPVDNTPSFLEDTPGPKATLANNPLKGAETRTFVPQLRAFLKEKLPEYMIPSHFTILDTLPLTAHGKVDRQALPSPDETRPDLEQSFVAPSTPVETALAEIWAQVLNINRVGIHDNFFDLGGHSLSATQVISRVRSTLNIDLPLQNLFQEPTIAGLAFRITSDPSTDRAALRSVEEKLRQVERLSEEETRALLADSD